MVVDKSHMTLGVLRFLLRGKKRVGNLVTDLVESFTIYGLTSPRYLPSPV